MESEFHENCILTGIVGSFCLICEKYVSKTDLPVHIVTSEHKEKLKSSTYLDKYKDDHIRKVKAGYFCVPCNMIIQTASKVGIHVDNTTHTAKKTCHLIKEVDGRIVVFDDILIDQQAWNGQNEESCYVCNMDYSNENDHACEPLHILNVIQSKLELGRDKFVYRNVDDAFLNCLICNSLINADSKESHVEDSEHVTNYIKCQENFKNFKVQSEYIESTNVEIKPTEAVLISTENVDKINVEEIDEGNVEDINEGNMKEKPDCEQLSDDSKENDLVSPIEALNNVKQFAKDNHLKYKRNSTYCKVCNAKISSSLKRLKEHVAEETHKEKAAKFTKDVEKVEKVPYITFFNSEYTVEDFFVHDIVINEKFCLSYTSLHTLSKHGVKVRCQLCEVSMHHNEIALHVRMWKHMQGMQEAFVLTSFDNEFIREVRPGLYHCGYCNLIEASTTGLKNHLTSLSHVDEQHSAVVRLRIHMPSIREFQQRHLERQERQERRENLPMMLLMHAIANSRR